MKLTTVIHFIYYLHIIQLEAQHIMDFYPRFEFDQSKPPDVDAYDSYNFMCGQEKGCIKCPPCSNDGDCILYGTCCLDKALEYWKNSSIDKTIEGKQDFNNSQKAQKNVSRSTDKAENLYTTCREVSPFQCTVDNGSYFRYNGRTSRRIIMISKCPETFPDKATRDKCEGLTNFGEMGTSFRVFSQRTQITYANIYCLRCHSVSEDDISFWEPSIRCRDIAQISQLKTKAEIWKIVAIERSSCCVLDAKNFVNNTEVKTIPCQIDEVIVDTCNVTGLWDIYDPYIEKMCSQFTAVVAYAISPAEVFSYKNLYCAACNRKIYISAKCYTLDAEVATFSLASLIDFNPRKVIYETEQVIPDARDKVTCEADSEFDHLTEGCKKVQCDQRFQYDPTSKSCEFTFQKVSGLGYKIAVRLTPELNPYTTNIDALDKLIMVQVSQWMTLPFDIDEYDIEPLIIIHEMYGNDRFRLPIIREISPNTDLRLNTDFRPKKNTMQSMENVTAVNVSLLLRGKSGMDVYMFRKVVRQTFYQTWMLPSINFSVDIISECVKDGSLVSNVSNLAISSFVQNLNYPYRCTGKCVQIQMDYINIADMVTCPYIEYKSENISIDYQNNMTRISIGEYVINDVNDTEVKICDDFIKICISALDRAYYLNETKNVKNLTQPERIAENLPLTIVTVVATVISLLCLLLTFITYCLFPSLRTLPGLNTMALILNLFLAQLVFQAGVTPRGDDLICQFLGVVIHYLWMSAFAWMSICAFHVFLIFRDVLRATEYKSRRRFFLYLTIGNILPAVIPAICVLYHYTQNPNTTDFGYGGWICFLNTPQNIAYFFAIPLGIILFLNMTFFTFTIISFRKQSDMSSTSNQNNHGHFCVYVKLSALLGLTWVLGLLAAALNFEPLWYIFTIVNASQGLFIFLAYCANSKTYAMYRDICKKQSSPESHTKSTSL